jgi:hypothetical protein
MPEDLTTEGVFEAAHLIGEQVPVKEAPTGLTCQRCGRPFSFTDPCCCDVLYGTGWIIERG